jgi:hypothetical protein
LAEAIHFAPLARSAHGLLVGRRALAATIVVAVLEANTQCDVELQRLLRLLVRYFVRMVVVLKSARSSITG